MCSTSIWGQSDSISKSNSIQVYFGLNKIKEKNLNNKVHSGISYLLKYDHVKIKRNLSKYNFSFLFSKIKTPYESASNSMNIQLNGNCGYLFSLKKTKKYDIFLGPNISGNYRLLFFPNWDDSHLYWANDFSLNISNRVNYSLTTKTSLLFDFDISVLSLFNRPELYRNYKIDDVSVGGIIKNMNSNFNFGTVNRVFKFHFLTEYQFQISNKVKQAIIYSFNYNAFNAKESMPFQNVIHQLSFKIYF